MYILSTNTLGVRSAMKKLRLNLGITFVMMTLLGTMWIVVTMLDGARWPVAPLH